MLFCPLAHIPWYAREGLSVAHIAKQCISAPFGGLPMAGRHSSLGYRKPRGALATALRRSDSDERGSRFFGRSEK